MPTPVIGDNNVGLVMNCAIPQWLIPIQTTNVIVMLLCSYVLLLLSQHVAVMVEVEYCI